MAELSDLSTAVMTHPLRRRLARDVSDSLSALEPVIVMDPDPWDKPRTLRTSIQAWDSVRTDSEYHLVVQDDALPGKRFTEHVADIIAHDPDRPVALFAICYSGNGWAVRWASAWGARFVSGLSEYVPCVALLLPADAARGYVRFARAWGDADTPDDYVMKAYLADAKLELLLSVPSLVEHRPVRSLIGNDFRGAAACVADPPRGWFRVGATVLEGYEAIPLLRDGELYLYRREASAFSLDDGGSIPFEVHARRIGIDLDALADRYNRFLSSVPDELVDQWFVGAHPRVLWTAWLTGYVLRNYRPPGECSFAEPDPMVLNQSLRTILTEFSDAHVCLENLDILLPVVADGFATIDKTITLGRNAI